MFLGLGFSSFFFYDVYLFMWGAIEETSWLETMMFPRDFSSNKFWEGLGNNDFDKHALYTNYH